MFKCLSLVILAAASLAATAGPAAAQRDDRAYCDKLIATYERYLAPRTNEARSGSDIDGVVAVGQCRAGDTARGIPVLERRLRNGGFSLPAA